jgi:hypothetical protein
MTTLSGVQIDTTRPGWCNFVFLTLFVTGISTPPRARICSEGYWRRFADIGRGSVVTSMLDARNEGGTYQRVEVITGRQRRRRWTVGEKARIVAESLEAKANISDVAAAWLADC